MGHHIGTNAELDQVVRQLDGTFVELQISEALVAVNSGNRRRRPFGLGFKQFLRLFERIRTEFGKQMRLVELFEGSTIEHLARTVAGETAPARYSSLVPIQPHGSKPPFYCVHAARGEVLCLERLAHHLGDDQPFFGFQSPRHSGAPLRRVEDIAAFYLTELLDHQPCGLYYLGGWSFGALVAYEMAQRLRRDGREVALLVNLDQRNPNLNRSWSCSHATATSFLRNFSASVVRQLSQQDLGTVIKRQLAKIPGLQKWLDRFGGEKAALPNAQNEAPPLPEDVHQILMANYAAKDAYQPQSYPGCVTLFRARTQLRWRWEEIGLGWTELAADGVEVHGGAWRSPFHRGGAARMWAGS